MKWPDPPTFTTTCAHYVKSIYCDLINISNKTYVMFCAIWYHLQNFKNVKNTHEGVLLLVKLQAFTILHGCFSCFLNCTNGTKNIAQNITIKLLTSDMLQKLHPIFVQIYPNMNLASINTMQKLEVTRNNKFKDGCSI